MTSLDNNTQTHKALKQAMVYLQAQLFNEKKKRKVLGSWDITWVLQSIATNSGAVIDWPFLHIRELKQATYFSTWTSDCWEETAWKTVFILICVTLSRIARHKSSKVVRFLIWSLWCTMPSCSNTNFAWFAKKEMYKHVAKLTRLLLQRALFRMCFFFMRNRSWQMCNILCTNSFTHWRVILTRSLNV